MAGKAKQGATFGERLTWVLAEEKKAGRTRGAVAKAAGFHQNRLTDWTDKAAPVQPDGENLKGLIRALPRVNVRWLLTGDGDPYASGEEAVVRLGWVKEALAREYPISPEVGAALLRTSKRAGTGVPPKAAER